MSSPGGGPQHAAVAFLGTNFSSGSTSSCLSGRLVPYLRHSRGPLVEILSLKAAGRVNSMFWTDENSDHPHVV